MRGTSSSWNDLPWRPLDTLDRGLPHAIRTERGWPRVHTLEIAVYCSKENPIDGAPVFSRIEIKREGWNLAADAALPLAPAACFLLMGMLRRRRALPSVAEPIPT